MKMNLWVEHIFIQMVSTKVDFDSKAKGNSEHWFRCCFSYLVEYNPPNPQPGQGMHRFYFFVFEQKERLVDGIHIANRCGFNIDAFIQDFDLKPVAMNMFRSEYQNVIVISELILT